MGGEGVKKIRKNADVVYGRPLKRRFGFDASSECFGMYKCYFSKVKVKIYYTLCAIVTIPQRSVPYLEAAKDGQRFIQTFHRKPISLKESLTEKMHRGKSFYLRILKINLLPASIMKNI